MRRDHVKVLLDGDATRRGILEAIDGYTKLTDRDCLFIYYAGHGEMDENRNGFWVPCDAPQNDKFSYIPNSQIVNDYFKKFRVKHLLVAADSCFSGTMLRGVAEQKREQDWALPSGFRKPSRWILTSGDLMPVPDDAGTGHSPFATRILQFLTSPGAPVFGVLDLYVYVRANLKSSSPICQPLDTEAHMPGGEYIFCKTGSIAEPDRRALAVKAVARYAVLLEGEKKDAATRQEAEERCILWRGYISEFEKSGVGVSDARAKVLRYETWVPRAANGDVKAFDLGGGVRVEMVYLHAGEFSMGSPVTESGRDAEDEAQRRVALTRGFWLAKYEVTQELWEKVMGANPAVFVNPKNPVEKVSWEDCQRFIGKLNTMASSGAVRANLSAAGASGRFRLPTEAEWEYACRAGTSSPFHCGDGLDSAAANFDGDCPYGAAGKGENRQMTVPVGQFAPNKWGLHDMHGNVWEWCQDWYGPYRSDQVTDPEGPSSGSARVCRGGGWGYDGSDCRSANRNRFSPGFRGANVGVRLAMD
jgi:formylglycine-generating enzyme required for sulfatase activity